MTPSLFSHPPPGLMGGQPGGVQLPQSELPFHAAPGDVPGDEIARLQHELLAKKQAILRWEDGMKQAYSVSFQFLIPFNDADSIYLCWRRRLCDRACPLFVRRRLCDRACPLFLIEFNLIMSFLILSSFKGFCLYVYMYIGLCFVCVVVRFMDIRVCHCITML